MDSDAGRKMEQFLNAFHPSLLLNKVDGSEDIVNGLAVKVAARDLLSVEMEYLGAIHRHAIVEESVKEMIPFIKYDTNNQASRDLGVIVIQKILEYDKLRSYQMKFSLNRQLSKKEPVPKESRICSVDCSYWEDCGFQNGGYPCKLQHLTQVKGFHGE